MRDSKDAKSGPHPSDQGVSAAPKAVISRLSLYLRELQHLVREGHETTNSTHLGTRLGFTDAQVRKDLAFFGQFGYPGIGYRCGELITEIRRILGTNSPSPVAIVGIGNLGRALLGYKGFEQQGFRIVAAFDIDTSRVGEEVEGIRIYHLDDLAAKVRSWQVKLAILAVPAAAAREVAARLVAAGIEGIMNFAPVTLPLPDHVCSVGVDLAIELEQLSFAVVNRQQNA